jgi:ABC-type uncharacterized transport system permease subunit
MTRPRDGGTSPWISIAPVVVAILVVVGFMVVAGFDVPGAAAAAFRGAFGSPFAVISATLKRSVPLMIVGLAVAVAFRAGVLNIGGEGQFLVGAIAAAVVGRILPATSVPVAAALPLLAGGIAGAVWAGIAAALRRASGATEVVTTLLLNLIAVQVVGYLVRGPLQEPTHAFPQSAELPAAMHLPMLFNGQRLHAGFLLALGLVALAWGSFRYSAIGFRTLVTGLSPSAAAVTGRVDVARLQFFALTLSGAIAGVAGAVEVGGVTYTVYDGIASGVGYTAIAVALLGNLNPIGIVGAAVLFGALGAGADAMQRDAGVPAELGSVLAALVVLAVLVAQVIRAPQRSAAIREP